jgi:hypothetical protein
LTDTTTPSDRSRPPSRRNDPLRRLGRVAGVVVLVVALLLAALYLNRRAAAREVLVGWLDRRGVQAEVEVERIELDGFVGRIRIGDPKNPDVTVERVEVDYAVAWPWSKTGLGVTPSRVRLVRPVMRASWKDGKLAFGSLDPVIKSFTGGPPRPDARAPLIIVEDGRALLETDYGAVRILGDARVDDGKLTRLKAAVPATVLQSGEVQAQGFAAAIDLTTTGDRVKLRLRGEAERFVGAGLSGRRALLSLDGDLPYPDLKTRRGDGRARLHARLTGEVLGLGATQARDTEIQARFDGRTAGWIEDFQLDGETGLALTAAAVDGPGLKATQARVRAEGGRLEVKRADALGWGLETPLVLTAEAGAAGGVETRGLSIRSGALTLGGRDAAFEATGPVKAGFDRIGWGDLTLRRGTADLSLDVVKDEAVRIVAQGAIRSADGAWPLFGPVGPDDIAELAEMKRALGGFALNAPAVRLVTGSAGTEASVLRPVTAKPANGGVLTLSQPAGQTAYAAEPGRLGGGALRLVATRGRGLPEMAVDVPQWRLTDAGFEAQLDGRARLDFDVARGIDARTRGLLALADGRITYTTPECVDLTVERLELDENDVHEVAGALCPTDAPLLSAKEGVWRVVGGFDRLSAQAPFLGMRFEGAAGRVTVDGASSGVGLTATVTQARAVDALTPKRFEPLAAVGQVRLAEEVWRGGFDLEGTGKAAGAAMGRLTLTHDGRSGAGGLQISVPQVTFVEGGLQPAMLTPLVADLVQSPVTGSVAFEGRFDWTKTAEPTSSGRLSVPGLDFVSPAGAVKGVKGDIVFTSLTPLITAPDQKLTVDSLAVGTEATDLDLTFAVDAAGIKISAGSVQAGGGVVSVEPFVVPLDAAQPYDGVVVLDRVQLGDVVADTGFDDKVVLDAVVSGRLPFTMDPKTGLTIRNGSLAAVQPGRLSIKREVLTDVDAGGGGAEVPPNMVEDLAYQAMENLAFDVLSADVNSLDGGRLSVLFRIRGRHAPPQRQELRLTLAELISREFLKRELPLPSGTQIDLTLDTTLNANQLFSDLLAVNRARQGQQEETAP